VAGRDLHDVVAHGVSVIVVQAEAGEVRTVRWQVFGLVGGQRERLSAPTSAVLLAVASQIRPGSSAR